LKSSLSRRGHPSRTSCASSRLRCSVQSCGCAVRVVHAVTQLQLLNVCALAWLSFHIKKAPAPPVGARSLALDAHFARCLALPARWSAVPLWRAGDTDRAAGRVARQGAAIHEHSSESITHIRHHSVGWSLQSVRPDAHVELVCIASVSHGQYFLLA